MKAYVLIEAAPGKVRDILKDLAGKQRANSKVVALDAIAGPYDLVAILEGPDIDSIGTLVTEAIDSVAGVERTLTCIAVHDIADYYKFLEELEELESIRAYDAAKASGDETIPFEQAVARIERDRRWVIPCPFCAVLRKSCQLPVGAYERVRMDATFYIYLPEPAIVMGVEGNEGWKSKLIHIP